ncbi:hypothetical protein [Faucicola atlantae]|uniref:Uncharacterized protein n=1 Tax=Faucicola atlantae TaxID=34059 RepID=A0A1B8QGR7_9GAMM|nr:hypothetical protein [Moraxella atlantae]OBX82224.1 hypothetical protein A9306_06100 [Moraxella atlantae]
MSISTQNTRLIATDIAIASSLSLANPSFAQTVKTAANHTVIHKTTAKPSTTQPTVHQTAEKTAQASSKSLTPALYK